MIKFLLSLALHGENLNLSLFRWHLPVKLFIEIERISGRITKVLKLFQEAIVKQKRVCILALFDA